MGGKHFAFSILLLSTTWVITCNASHEEFVSCMGKNGEFLYDPGKPLYMERFNQSIQNGRKFSLDSSKPAFIFVPKLESEIQAAVVCCKKHGLQIRVKSGGHDYESLSLLAGEPYIVLDLFNHQNIDIDLKSETAWVETGATLGGLYYSISEKSKVLGFPGGACPSVGTGGHISGGGWGWLARKYGLAADNVLDARLIDVNGTMLTRATMGEDLFWAIRGSGGASFGIITAWKLQLVRVPPVVTWAKVIDFNTTAIDKFYTWQTVAPKLPKDIFIAAMTKTGNNSFKAIFKLQFLGPKAQLLPLMQKEFPELGLKDDMCKEMSWIEAIYTNTENGSPIRDALLMRKDGPRSYKGKSDYIQKPIPKEAIFGTWDKFLRIEEPTIDRIMFMYPLGGRIDEIGPDVLPFPHRKGNLYGIEYLIKWPSEMTQGVEQKLQWVRDLYKYMEPYASQNPRTAYINYKDLDLGTNGPSGKTNYHEAKAWGEKYFLGNFEKLAKIKSKVDPENFFRNEQSIPPFTM